MLDRNGQDFGDIRRVLESGMRNGAVSLMKDVSRDGDADIDVRVRYRYRYRYLRMDEVMLRLVCV